MKILGLGILFAIAIALMQSPARAVTDEERAGARAAAGEGMKAFDQRRYSDAIDLFRRAEAIVHSPVHLLYIARAQVALGQLVQARETLIKIVSENIPAGAPEAFAQAKQDAAAELEKLDPRVPYVTVTVVGEGTETATVTMDGVRVPPTLIGVPRPVNPGTHQFQAVTSSMESDAVDVEIAEGMRQTVSLKLHEKGVAGPASTVTEAPPGEGAPPPFEGEDTGGGGPSGLRIGSYVAFGVGAIGLGLGIGFAIKSSNKDSEEDALFEECSTDEVFDPNKCQPGARQAIDDLNDEATSAAGIATAGFIIGGVGIAAGVTLLVLSLGEDDGSSETASAPAVRPYVGLGELGLQGTF